MKWIATITRITFTDRVMVLNGTCGMSTTHPGTGIFALVPNASKMGRTLCVNSALWLAFNVWISLQARHTLTRSSSPIFAAFGIKTTGGRIAGIYYFWAACSSWEKR